MKRSPAEPVAKIATSDPTDIPGGVPEERVDALYGLPLEEFTKARDACRCPRLLLPTAPRLAPVAMTYGDGRAQRVT